MGKDERTRGVLAHAATAPVHLAAEESTVMKARAVALAALRNISSASCNKEPMWADTAVRAAIIAAASINGGEISTDARESRMHAVAALKSFASVNSGVKDTLWADSEPAKAALVAAAKLSTVVHADHRCREYAIAALRYI